MNDPGRSIISLYGCHTSKSCGYCTPERKGKDKHTTFGMVAARLTVDDYQELLDRGWRRSGTYLYKHDNMTACCPNLTIRLDVARFIASKKQTRLLRRAAGVAAAPRQKVQRRAAGPSAAQRALAGQLRQRVASILDAPVLRLSESMQQSLARRLAVVPVTGAEEGSFRCNLLPLLRAAGGGGPTDDGAALEFVSRACSSVPSEPSGGAVGVEWSRRGPMLVARIDVPADLPAAAGGRPPGSTAAGAPSAAVTAGGAGEVPAAGGVGEVPAAGGAGEVAPRLSDWRVEVLPAAFRPEAFDLYKRYQMAVHNDPEEKLRAKSYKRFLCDSPLVQRPLRPSERAARDPPPASQCLVGFKDRSEAGGLGASNGEGGTGLRSGFGSFHHHVYFRDRLVAVEVVDVLPRCMSSVYVFSDPAESRLELGKWTALRAVQWVQVARRVAPALQYYYMGYYVPKCPKMVYKAEYRPSQLLCQVTGRWVALPRAVQCLAAANAAGKPCDRFAPSEAEGGAGAAVDNDAAAAAGTGDGPVVEGGGWDLPLSPGAVRRQVGSVPLAIAPATPPVLISQLVPRAMEVLGDLLSQYVRRVGAGLAGSMVVRLYRQEDSQDDEEEAEGEEAEEEGEA